MRYKIIATISLVAVGGLASGCSRTSQPSRLRQQLPIAPQQMRQRPKPPSSVKRLTVRPRQLKPTPIVRSFTRTGSEHAHYAGSIRIRPLSAHRRSTSAARRQGRCIAGQPLDPRPHRRNADDSGSDEYNMALSQKRAGIAHRYLTERGVDGSRLQIVSFGEEATCTANREEPCRAQNRRDEFVVLRDSKQGETKKSRTQLGAAFLCE